MIKGGYLRLVCNKESTCAIEDLAGSMNFIYEDSDLDNSDLNSFGSLVSYYALSFLHNRTDEEFLEKYHKTIEYFENKDKHKRIYEYYKKNISKLRKALEDFDEEFLQKLNERLNEKSGDYVVGNGSGVYIFKETASAAYTTDYIKIAKVFKKYRAIRISKYFLAFKPIKI